MPSAALSLSVSRRSSVATARPKSPPLSPHPSPPTALQPAPRPYLSRSPTPSPSPSPSSRPPPPTEASVAPAVSARPVSSSDSRTHSSPSPHSHNLRPRNLSHHPPPAVARPAANPELFQRQGSLRMPIQNGPAFRRHASLRMADLPSTLQRQQQLGIPGARVSAIPEEDPGNAFAGGSSAAAELASLRLDAAPTRGKLIHADTVGGTLPSWDTGSANSARFSDNSGPASSRSRAEEWLESTLQSTASSVHSVSPPPLTNGGHNGHNGHASPPPSTASTSTPMGQDILRTPRFRPARHPSKARQATAAQGCLPRRSRHSAQTPGSLRSCLEPAAVKARSHFPAPTRLHQSL